ncbi:hypothetical protein Sgly_2138 [Syntrophobotulus glycolicus DSM 8271]|uniref:Uncharacterized protein n=1 Tax=Syntrophobotulus glycolicus (strain DSM 8271 / FlGlyR) TaxID=645991 RepID=F0T2M9_SYNGF|nr:hypothetical protein [Syntrophobotulus glycolicus]ADY56428.1 hypothetical protein Sgly_2138 [Syntrophobotulus glycolicus DSM 8271]
MKQVVFGGLLFVGGSVILVMGQSEAPYIGAFFMLVGLAVGIFGLMRKEK